jgi:hypothetical protein
VNEQGDPQTEHTEIVQPQSVPAQILKRRGAINLYYTAVGAIAAVVVFVPVISIWAAMPDVAWNGWMLSLGGFISLLGAQSVAQNGGAQ